MPPAPQPREARRGASGSLEDELCTDAVEGGTPGTGAGRWLYNASPGAPFHHESRGPRKMARLTGRDQTPDTRKFHLIRSPIGEFAPGEIRGRGNRKVMTPGRERFALVVLVWKPVLRGEKGRRAGFQTNTTSPLSGRAFAGLAAGLAFPPASRMTCPGTRRGKAAI